MIFSKLKESGQKAYRIESYDEIFANTLASMFTYNGLPETVDLGILELVGIIEGHVALWEHPKFGWIASQCNTSGLVDPYGLGYDMIVRALDGTTKTFENWRENKDIIVLWNNSIKMPDMNIGRFSDMLAEVETSMKLNVYFSRMYPIPVAKDENVQKAIKETITKMLDGQVKDGMAILAKDAISRVTEAGATIDTVKLTDEKQSQYIQYLAHFRDDLMRWFYSLYGMNTQGSSKMAQQTVDEVNQDNNASMIIPHDMLRARQSFIEQAKTKQPELFADAAVSFSECWMSRLANMDDEFKETDEEIEGSPEGAGKSEGGEPNED